MSAPTGGAAGPMGQSWFPGSRRRADDQYAGLAKVRDPRQELFQRR